MMGMVQAMLAVSVRRANKSFKRGCKSLHKKSPSEFGKWKKLKGCSREVGFDLVFVRSVWQTLKTAKHSSNYVKHIAQTGKKMPLKVGDCTFGET